MNKLLIALTVGLLASSAVFAQASSIPGTAPANTVAAASAPAAKSGTVKKSKKATHKAKAAKSASSAQVDPNEAHN